MMKVYSSAEVRVADLTDDNGELETVYVSSVNTRDRITGIIKWGRKSPQRTEYVVDGHYHREDGPAITISYLKGNRYKWYYKGRHLTFDDYVKVAKWTDEQIVEWKLMYD